MSRLYLIVREEKLVTLTQRQAQEEKNVFYISLPYLSKFSRVTSRSDSLSLFCLMNRVKHIRNNKDNLLTYLDIFTSVLNNIQADKGSRFLYRASEKILRETLTEYVKYSRGV